MELIVNERIESNAEVMNKVKIKNFTNVITGGTPSTSKAEYWENGNIPWLNSGELNQKIVTKSKNHITKLGLEKSSTRLMPKETVLMALTGSTTGVVGYLTFEACANQSVTGILPSEKHIPKYLYHYLNFIRPKVVSDAYGGAQPHISQGYVKELEIPLPSLEQQQKIAEILDTADQLRQYNKQLIAKYDALTQSLFLEMFGDPVRNEKGWEKTEVINYCTCIVPGRDKPKSFTGNIPWVTTDDLIQLGKTYNSKKNIGLTEDEILNVRAKKIPVGSVIMTCVGNLGVITINEVEMIINQQLHAFQCLNELNNVFLMHCLSYQKSYMYKMASSTTVPYMNKTVCNKIPIIVPPMELQTQFAERVQMIETQKQQAQEALAKSEDLFQSLLQRVFKGDLA